MNQYRLPRFQAAKMQHGFVRSDEHFGDGGGVDIVQLGGNGQSHAPVQSGNLRISAAAHHTHHAVTGLEAAHGAAGLQHFARDFQAHDGRVAEIRAAVAATAVGQVGAIYTGCMDADDEIIRPHFGLGNVGHFKHVGLAKLFKNNRFHCLSFRSFVCDTAKVACAIAEAVIAAGNPT